MKWVALIAAVAIGAGSAAAASSARKPALRLVRGTDALVVYGTGFYANERVRVRVVTTSEHTRIVRARAGGVFAARFGSVAVTTCDEVAVFAVGGRGDRAVLKIFPRECIPARSP